MIKVKNANRLRTVRRSVLIFRMTFMACLMAYGQGDISQLEITAWQKDFVAQLTGAKRLNDGREVISVRSTTAQRKRAADFLCKTMRSLGLQPSRQDYKMKNSIFLLDLLFAPFEGTNVYSVIPATEKSDEYVILGAHYDSEPGSPGAGDNASGVAMVLGVAQQVSQLKVRKKNFVMVLFDQEEDDEVGSRAFARNLRKCNVNVHSVHVTDVIGWDPEKTGNVDLQSPAPHIKSVYEVVAASMDIPLIFSKGGSSDNKSFQEHDYPTVGVFADKITPYIHTEKDTYETVDFDYLANATTLVFNVMKQLAVE